MAIKKIYTCTNCDAQFPKWSGRCLECGSWGTLGEDVIDSQGEKKEEAKKIGDANVIDLRELQSGPEIRIKSGLEEIDRVLGGGLLPGSLILLSGEPGIGKSTLAAQLADKLSAQGEVLYVSGEESAAQVKSRLTRLNCDLKRLRFIGETSVEKIAGSALKMKPALMVVDSIQTVYSSLIPSEAGSLSQIRAVAVKFLELAKEHGITVLLIGHITKDGQVAGPKSLEHIVDTVLSLENESGSNYCLLRASKNRFGSVNELGVLEMTGAGFIEAKDPSSVFLGSGADSIAGSVIGCVLEGTRPFLVNIQALVTKTVFGYPQRKASGLDLNRLQVLSAVIAKRSKINLVTRDIILNAVGGLKINDPALDLAVCAAIISSYLNKPLPAGMVVIGEVGLGAELRPVFRLEQRLREAEKLGFKSAAVPSGTEYKGGKLKLLKIKNLADLVEIM
ncbi:DNA repair protein RadA [Candidatus Falkowbacteria bacterium HGW-Falkowbacteria-2]|uniref:DNA repair protein RadA n=1 Tax=Candidatus Falkowbacteria bacterium HGW-Falkowbacteria-2 TaxID=2013769 RepID=A0A2N2E2X8_9BACT|nr:MAG: DNA repair protein RadA [Candidatus Falkowbacteria bacterium HGW-Falkowbacteria-2]